ncbi:MAG: beta-ketoacyl-[acyl-carrier-protein] synthase family protein [Polyangiaceae bacterium]|jgi:3-oxoacyl-[acyl-carrier-protein] synthase II|nr:beta-ketoacyl-[acyl-carrier-protein] synthase family protein [Polyangiaceae bacterium]MBK8941249.1 beta-ketoacyl-[acyl-carrier-protein] synthase family protein [Polyangiaceae bacterium]
MRRRVVVTGVGMVTPLGHDAESTWAALRAGRSGVGFIEDFPTDKLRSDVAAMVKGYDPRAFLSNKEAEIYGRVVPFALGAAIEALRMAGLDHPKPEDEVPGPGGSRLPVDPSQIGCLMSTGQGAVDIFEQQIMKSAERGPRAVSPFFIPAVMLNIVSALVSMRYGFMGPSYNIASACATGTHSVATGALMIEAGEADVMVVGGSEAATRLNTVAGFGNARALGRSVDGDPTKTSRPFDKKRTGFVMGEGAGALVLEAEESANRRGAKPIAVVAGFGMTTDGEHLTRPHSGGVGLRLAIERALARAGIGPGDVGYINPHATSTTQGDVAEYLALKEVFRERLATIPMSATKSMLGHLLGGAGGVEAAVTALTLRDQVMHPSINVDELGDELELDLVRTARPADLRYALKVSAGFGGHNCALVLSRVT